MLVLYAYARASGYIYIYINVFTCVYVMLIPCTDAMGIPIVLPEINLHSFQTSNIFGGRTYDLWVNYFHTNPSCISTIMCGLCPGIPNLHCHFQHWSDSFPHRSDKLDMSTWWGNRNWYYHYSSKILLLSEEVFGEVFGVRTSQLTKITPAENLESEKENAPKCFGGSYTRWAATIVIKSWES